MDWVHKTTNENEPFTRLATVAVRLIRIAAYEQLARGETQLKAHGIPADLTSNYKQHIREERKQLLGEAPPKPPSRLRVISKGTF